MRDLLTEIWESVRRNKLRTALTGFAVAWGIFMLIVLLGAGNGLVNSFSENSGQFASNTMMVGGGWTSKPYDGLKQGRRIRLEEKDMALTAGPLFAGTVDAVTANVSASDTVSRGKLYFYGSFEGVYPVLAEMEKVEILHGRFINDLDIRERRKVVVLPENLALRLTVRGESAADLVGQRVKIGKYSVLVCGITKTDEMRNDDLCYAPFTTIKAVYGKGNEIGEMTFSFHGLESEEENEAFEKEYKAIMNLSHRAAPDDEHAMWIWNRFTQNLQMSRATFLITLALWIIGLFTLVSGIVGVSNIMLITVKERTHEFGIRKAIGATPSAINKLIITESVVITSVFGYVGMVLGLLACEFLDKFVGGDAQSMMGGQMNIFVNPTVGLDVALEATFLLIVAGTLAGLVPALKAAKVKPIEALRAE